jgi:hypothetical protein
MSMESSGTSKNNDEAAKLIGLGLLGMVILICVIVGMLQGSEKAVKPSYPVCDYCRIPQRDAKPFPCRKCGNVHLSCGRESGLRAFDARKDKEGVAIGRSIKICPEGGASAEK